MMKSLDANGDGKVDLQDAAFAASAAGRKSISGLNNQIKMSREFVQPSMVEGFVDVVSVPFVGIANKHSFPVQIAILLGWAFLVNGLYGLVWGAEPMVEIDWNFVDSMVGKLVFTLVRGFSSTIF